MGSRRSTAATTRAATSIGFEDLAEFVARDVMINGTDRGMDAYAQGLRAVVRAFPDYHWELRHLLVDPPWIAAPFTDTGTHGGPFLGVAATGRSVSTQEFAFYRVDAGRIAVVWGTADDLHLLQQLRQRTSKPPLPSLADDGERSLLT
jgi:aspartyl-tRNA synthetase